MTYASDRCEKREYPRNSKVEARDYAYATGRAHLHRRGRRFERGYAVATHFAEVIGSRNSTHSPKAAAEALQGRFDKLAKQWRLETRFSSSLDEKVLNPAYQSIIAMGEKAVPLVLVELDRERGHWLWALHFMTGVDPVPEGANVEAARQAWLKWGREEGLLK